MYSTQAWRHLVSAFVPLWKYIVSVPLVDDKADGVPVVGTFVCIADILLHVGGWQKPIATVSLVGYYA